MEISNDAVVNDTIRDLDEDTSRGDVGSVREILQVQSIARCGETSPRQGCCVQCATMTRRKLGIAISLIPDRKQALKHTLVIRIQILTSDQLEQPFLEPLYVHETVKAIKLGTIPLFGFSEGTC